MPIVLVWLISFPLYAAPTLTLTYAGDTAKSIAGVKIVMTESDSTETIYATDVNGQMTLTTTTNTYTLAASLAETGDDPVDLLDAIWILQHSGELRTLTADQLKAADVSGDGEVDLLDAIYILQHSGELRTLTPNLVFLDAATGNDLSETTFSPGDTPSVTVIRTGDVDQGFDPTAITDHAPILTGKTTLSIDENETAVSTLVGTDADADTLTYSITGGADQDLFAINASTGVLSFIAGPDYEDPGDSGADNLYDVEITVSDGTNNNTQALVVSVGDLNDRGPVISNLATSVSIEENQISVVTVSATDADGDSLTYTLGGTDAAFFSISSSGVIAFDSAPDYETKTSYSITVNVSDGVNTDTQALTIIVTNVNDVAPVISSSATYSAAENQTVVGTVSASDADGDSLTYSLSGTDASSFSINSSGVITFDSAPDYETKTSYSITVNVSDGVNTDTQALTIIVTNVNDVAPVISSSATYSAAENQTAVGTVSASDVEDDSLTYILSGTDASSFSINSSTGVIAFTSAPDYETKTSYSITVNVSDGVNTTTQALTIAVTNVNDNDPAISSSATFSATENQTAVGTVSASDADGDSLTYSLSGTNAASFSISSSGVITFDSAPDYETKTSYSVTVTVSDGVNTDTQAVTVNVTNVNDAWVQRGSDIDGEAAGDSSGDGISIGNDGNTVAISAPNNGGNNGSGSATGHVRIFDWDDSAWVQRGTDIDGEKSGDGTGKMGDRSISDDGNTVAVGSLNAGTDSGHVRVFDWDGSAWAQRGSDIDGEAAGDQSGTTSISSDGDTVAIGALLNDGNGTDSGHARIYDWNGSAWVQRGSDIDGEAAADYFGYYLSISNDGDTVAVGAWNNDGNGTDSGHARVFDWNGSAWVQRGSDIDGEAAGDNFSLVSMSIDGDTVAVGAWYNDGNGSNSGHARVFDWNGSAWVQRGADIDGEAAGDENSVASISNDGDTVAIGAYYNDGNGSNSGHVRVFDWNGSAWVQRGADIDGEAADDLFGYYVSISNDGDTVAVGAFGNDGNGTDSGHVRVFDWK